ncbi:MAG: hypothetical protein KC445_14115 [Anaerolineales bacterium]|nr:hypothetical protein [Anaerolineales bacterium]
MNQTNLLDLRPLTIGELFDRSFRLYRKNFGTFLGIVFVTQIPVFLFQIATIAFSSSSISRGGAGVFGPIATLIFTQIGAAALTKAISDTYLGRSTTFRGAFQRMGGTWFTLIFATIAAALVVGGLAIPIALIGFIPILGPIIAIFGYIFIFLIAIVLVSLVPPVVVLEKSGVIASVKRAWALAKLRFWWAFGYLVVLGIMSILIISGPTALISALFNTVLTRADFVLQSIIVQTANLVLTTIFQPIRIAAITLMYFDLRIRFEGFDLMVLSAASDAPLDDASELTTKRSL